MPERELIIGGRAYRVACNPGEEERLSHASRLLDRHASVVAEQAGKLAESRALLLSALLLADEMLTRNDELSAFRERARALEGGAGDAQVRLERAEAAGAEASARAAAAEERIAYLEEQLEAAQSALQPVADPVPEDDGAKEALSAALEDAELANERLQSVEAHAQSLQADLNAAIARAEGAEAALAAQPAPAPLDAPQMGLFGETAQPDPSAMALLARIADELETIADDLEANAGNGQNGY